MRAMLIRAANRDLIEDEEGLLAGEENKHASE